MSRGTLRWVLVLFFSSLILMGQIWAQAEGSKAATAEVPKFTSKSQLVLVPVVVTGKNGEHVTGLGRGAFKVEEQGKVREATVFEEVKTVAPDAKAKAALTLEGKSNFNFDRTENWRMTVVVLDMLNTPFLAQGEGKRKLIQYLSKSLQRDEPTTLFGLRRNGLKQLHPFSTDTGLLIDALRKLDGQVSRDEVNDSAMTVSDDGDALSGAAQQIADWLNDSEALMNAYQQREAIRTTLTAMTDIAHAYAAIPGRKTMIWASGGFPFMLDDPQAFAHMGTDMVEKYEETWRALVSADIAVYTVDVTGLAAYSGGTAKFDAAQQAAPMKATRGMRSNAPAQVAYDKQAEKQATLRAFADATGGTPCVNTNDIEKCLSRAVDDSRQYYVLGYYLPSDDQKPGWRKLKVKVASEGAHVRAREGFYVGAAEEDTQATRERQILDALRSPVDFTGLRLNVQELPAEADAKPAAAGKSAHEFRVGILGSSLRIDGAHDNAVDAFVVSVALNEGGKNMASAQQRVAAKLDAKTVEKIHQAGLGVRLRLELAPGKYELRFVVRDNLSGEIGSVGYPLEVK